MPDTAPESCPEVCDVICDATVTDSARRHPLALAKAPLGHRGEFSLIYHLTTDNPAVLPAGAEKWRTPFLRSGESATHMFTVPGKYQYFCETHGPYGMIGTITVVP